MEIMNFFFCVCVTFFLYLHPPAAASISWKMKLGYFAFENLFAEESHSGATFPKDTHARLANTDRQEKDDSA